MDSGEWVNDGSENERIHSGGTFGRISSSPDGAQGCCWIGCESGAAVDTLRNVKQTSRNDSERRILGDFMIRRILICPRCCMYIEELNVKATCMARRILPDTKVWNDVNRSSC